MQVGMQLGSRGRRLVARLAFPLVLGGAVGAALLLIGRGVDPRIALIATQAPAFLVVIVLERIAPYHREWNRNHGDLRVDVGHMVTVTLVSGLGDPLLRLAGVSAATWLLGPAALDAWPAGWPLLGQLALALVLGELGQYWVHRLQHETDWLWRFHALHHSAPRLYWLNAARFHPLDIVLNNFVVAAPLAALGAGIDVLSLWLLVSAVHGVFQHANVPVRIGPLNWLFSMAELHRWHHSKTVRESNTNYGQNLIVWDVVFGTRFLPADREPPREIGIADLPHFPTGWLAQELAPFRWAAIRGERSAPAIVAESRDG
jgi:sterol desaturase/sphingolipid hydroxylase (fatty acid hydroxylase superfamily)